SNIWLPTKFVTDYLTVRTAGTIDPTGSGFVTVGAVISDNNIPAGVKVKGSNPATTILKRTDRLTLLAKDSEFASIDLPTGSTNFNDGRINIPASRIGDFTLGEVYFISNGATGVFGAITKIDKTANQIFWGEGDSLGLNRFGSTGNIATGTRYGNDPSSLLRMNIKQYYVDDDGRLMRRAFGVKGAGFIDSTVAEHLVSLQFRYTLRPSGTGTILSQPAEELDLSESTRVRMVEMNTGVETAYPLQDGYRHQIEGTANVGVRNIQFLEAPVPRDSEGSTALPNPQPKPVITPVPPPPPPPPTPITSPTPSMTPSTTPTPATGSPPPPPTPPPPPPPPPPTPKPTPTPTPTPVVGDN
ncbi:MAG: hypothetical protein ACR2J3_09965, partial [Aridibacter sp.]